MSCDATFGNWHGLRPSGYDGSLPLIPSEMKVFQAKERGFPLESPLGGSILPPSGGSRKGAVSADRADSASSSCRASSSGSYGKGNKMSRGGSGASRT